MPENKMRLEVAMLLVAIASNIGVALASRSKHRWVQPALATLGVVCTLGAAGLFLWPIISLKLWRVGLYGLAGLSVLYVYWDAFWRLRKAENAYAELEASLEPPALELAPSEGLERLREAWKACNPSMSTVSIWLVVLGDSVQREQTEAEKAMAGLARDFVGKPLEKLSSRVSEAMDVNHTLSSREYRDLGRLFALAAFKYCEATEWLVRLGVVFLGSSFLRDDRYRDLYESHVKCLDELRRISGRSDVGIPELDTAIFAVGRALPKPPSEDPQSPKTDS